VSAAGGRPTVEAAPRPHKLDQPADSNRGQLTGAHSDGRELLKMLDALAPGDVVTVTRLTASRAAPSTLFGIVKRIVDAKAQFRSLAEPWVVG
jgi:hypothetical protein